MDKNNAPAQSEQKTVTLRKNRIFVLDTNVLLHDSKSLFSFKGVVVGIPFVVLEELDQFKKETDEKGKAARDVIRSLDELRNRGSLSEGVELNHGTHSMLRVLPTPPNSISKEIDHSKADNIIIKTVQVLEDQGLIVTLVTKDINARVKADSLGLDAEGYTKGSITKKNPYKGWIRVPIPANELRKITASKIFNVIPKDKILDPNNFVILESENNPENNRLFRLHSDNSFREVKNFELMKHFSAKNIQQLMALDLLMDPEVQAITLLGQAGTGKTFLTLLAGLEQILYGKQYRKFLITRPIVALGKDIGYLPGGVEEKLFYWMQPVYDNMDFIFSKKIFSKEEIPAPTKHKKSHIRHKPFNMQSLKDKGIISLEAITYMRGRSIPQQFVFIDEVQNLTPHEVKTIVSRAGEGTKIILAGDPYQIDSPYLDFSSNGLTVTTDKLKGEKIFGTVFLEKSERSRLAEIAAEQL